MTRAGSDDCDHEIVEIPQERRGAHQRVEVLRVADVPGVHDHEPVCQARVLRPRIVLGERGQPRRIDPIRDHPHTVGRRALLLEPLAHRLPDRDEPVRAAQVDADEHAQQAHQRRVLQPLQLHCNLGKHILADDDERRPIAARDDERNVGDDGRIRHAEDDVGPPPTQSVDERVREVADVVRCAREDLRALERRRGNAHDLDPLVHEAAWLLLVAVEDAGHDLHVGLLRERLAQLGQQLRRRLDARPVVLVEHEQARLAGPRHARTLTSQRADFVCSARVVAVARVRRPGRCGA